jgi:hypothetical protein
MTNPAPYAHVPQAERAIRTLQQRIRSTLLDLRFDLPKRLLGRLVVFVSQSSNLFPDGRLTDGISPIQRVTGVRPNFKRFCRAAFGQFVAAYDPSTQHKAKGVLAPRVRTGIVVGRNYTTGAITVWTIPELTFIERSQIYSQQLSDLAIDAINRVARIDEINFADLPPMVSMKNFSNIGINRTTDLDLANDFDENYFIPGHIPSISNVPIILDTEEPPSTFDDFVDIQPEPPEFEDPAQLDILVQPDDPLAVLPLVEPLVEPTQPHVDVIEDPPPRYPTRSNRTPTNWSALLAPEPDIPEAPAEILYASPDLDDIHPHVMHISITQALQDDVAAAELGISNEISSIRLQQVLEPMMPNIDLQGTKVLSSFLFGKRKKVDGKTIMKFRFTVNGSQQYLHDYSQTAAPTVATETLFMLISYANAMAIPLITADVKTAYLHASIDELVFLFISPKEATYFLRDNPALSAFVDTKGRILMRVRKALYGLVQSAQLWYSHLASSLAKIHFLPTHQDRCAFVRTDHDKKSYILTYVDDLLIVAESKRLKSSIEHHLNLDFPGMKFHFGNNILFLGMEIKKDSLNYSTQVTLSEFTQNLVDLHEIKISATTPCHGNLMKAAEDIPVDTTDYLSLLMKLMYLAKHTRPDILFSCAYLATHAKEPKQYHWKQLIHILRYLRGTIHHGLRFSGHDQSIFCYSDASYALHADTKSHSGISIHLGREGPAIFALSKKQKIVSTSSTEAELIALHLGAQTSLWMHDLQNSLGISSNVPTLFEDNQPAIQLIRGGRPASNASKHIAVRFFSFTEKLKDGTLVLQHMPTADMVADILTKPLTGFIFAKLSAKILG